MSNLAELELPQIRIFNDNGVFTLHFIGILDENTDFRPIKLDGAKSIIVDLEKVTGLNSMGLRNWVLWTKSLKAQAQIFFRHCTRPVVDQMNILNGFLPMGAIVESFYVPYHCEGCAHDDNYLAVRGKDYMEGRADSKEGIKIPDERACTACGEPMQFDVVPRKYFGFLKYRK
jgi:anti-anti-sigma regulatory factor